MENMETIEKIVLTVTREDLKGEYTDIYDCPIARAAKRHFNTEIISVGGTDLFAPLGCFNFSNRDNVKAMSRSRSLWGKLAGGFKVELTKE